jgi:hypothetical protein
MAVKCPIAHWGKISKNCPEDESLKHHQRELPLLFLMYGRLFRAIAHTGVKSETYAGFHYTVLEFLCGVM